MSGIKVYILTAIAFLMIMNVNAQNYNQLSKEELIKELDNRNLDYEEVSTALSQNGIDLETIDPNSLTTQQRIIIQNVIADLTSKGKSKLPKSASTSSYPEKQQIGKATILDSIPTQVSLPNVQVELKKYEIWGQELFRENGLLRNRDAQLRASESYIIGPGDELIISIWGRSQVDKSHVVDDNGYIKVLNNRVRVYLKGISVKQARKKLETILSKEYNFSQGEFEIAVNDSRTIRISIYGEIIGKPGGYSISGFENAFNVLARVEGPNDFGSLRNIQLQKSNGITKTLDIYKFMVNPSIQSNFYLEENDIILVPIQDNIVQINGAVKRPLKYELLESEGLNDLIKFAGGFKENAYKQKIQVTRFVNDKQTVVDLNWNELQSKRINFKLLDGDYIFIENIEKEAKNYVSVIGEVDKPANYERIEGMRLRDLVEKVGLNEKTSRGILYLTRTNADGTQELLKLNLQDVLENAASSQNIILQDLDLLDFWSQERFADEAIISIFGAVREQGDYPYDQAGSIRVVDAITIAGGLRRDASNYVTIHKNDPLNQKRKYYKTIDNIQELINNPDQENNFVLNPFDSLVVESLDEFEEELYVRIEGAVNNPGKFQYGEDMTIKDLLILAKGFQRAASTNNIEVSRVVKKQNEPTFIRVALLEIDEDFNVLTTGVANGEYRLEPFDNIAVRYIKDYELQKRVFLTGEVEVPGPYAIYKDNLKISSVIERAGGLTLEAYSAGATLIRKDQNIGKVVIKLEEILSDKNSEFNFNVKNGDVIDIPTVNEFVTINGATRVEEVLGQGAISSNNEIKVPYQSGKDAMFYINEHAGGLAEDADKSKIFVKHANGEIKKPGPGFFKKRYPLVLQGSTITVGYKSSDELTKAENEEKTDWTKVLGDSVGQAMSILTLILLIQRLE